MSELVERIVELKKKNSTFCVITVVDSGGTTPRKAGARAIVFSDGTSEGTVGGGSIEVEAFKQASIVIKSGKPLLKNYQLQELETGPMVCGGSMTLFYEPVLPERRLTIFGGGHVGRSLARVSREAGWKITVIDDRQGVLEPQFFPSDSELICQDYTEFISNRQFGDFDWLVVVTPQHKNDEKVLEAIIKSAARYIGMMGSAKKVKDVFSNLKKNGIDEKLLKKVYAPIGLNIGIETPGEIAVSIVAEMLSVFYNIEQVKSCAVN